MGMEKMSGYMEFNINKKPAKVFISFDTYAASWGYEGIEEINITINEKKYTFSKNDIAIILQFLEGVIKK
jgi:hypothetical protein